MSFAFGGTMNKWQIICPLVAMLIVAMVAAYLHGQSQERGMRDAIERHLGSVLSELDLKLAHWKIVMGRMRLAD